MARTSPKIFGTLENFINDHLDSIAKIISDNLSGQLATLLEASILLYVVFYGYMILAGKIDEPVKDLIWNLAKFALLIIFIKNTGNWLDLTKTAIKALSSVSGSEGLGFIDDQISRVSDLAAKRSDKAPWGSGWVISLLIWAGFIFSSVPAVLLILANKFSLYLLLAFLPLFIFCLMWGWLRDSFNQYMSAILTNSLVIIVVTSVLRAIVEFFAGFEITEGNAFLIGISYCLIGWFGGYIVTYLALRATGLMRVSIEALPAAIGGSSSKMNSGAVAAGRATGKGAMAAGRTAKKAGAAAGQGAYSLYQRIKKGR